MSRNLFPESISMVNKAPGWIHNSAASLSSGRKKKQSASQSCVVLTKVRLWTSQLVREAEGSGVNLSLLASGPTWKDTPVLWFWSDCAVQEISGSQRLCSSLCAALWVYGSNGGSLWSEEVKLNWSPEGNREKKQNIEVRFEQQGEFINLEVCSSNVFVSGFCRFLSVKSFFFCFVF